MNSYIITKIKCWPVFKQDPIKVCFTETQKRLTKSQASRRTKCCESDSYSATHLCWVLDSVSPTHIQTLSRQILLMFEIFIVLFYHHHCL